MLEGKVAIVTGASRGIGAEVAKKLGSLGAVVVINYQGSEEKAEEVKNQIIAGGGEAITYRCDVSDFAACEKFIKEIHSQYKKIDILVNNAGITRDGLLMAMPEEDFDKVLNVNLKGTFNCIRFVSRFMVKQRSGKIINMSSISGLMGNAGQTNYSASKAGVAGLTKAAARELATRNIHVNAIAPGFIETDMTDVLPESVKSEAVKTIPLGRFGKAKDIAEVAAFLAGPGSDYITGQVIRVDGGM